MSLPLLGLRFLKSSLLLRNRDTPGGPSDNREITDSRESIRAVGLRLGFKLHSSCAAHRALFDSPAHPSISPRTSAACAGLAVRDCDRVRDRDRDRAPRLACRNLQTANETEPVWIRHFLVERTRSRC